MNPWKGIKGLPKNIWLISIASLINRSGTMVIVFLTLYVSQGLGEEPTSAGLVVAVYGLGAFVSAPFVGRLSDKIGELLLMKISLFGSAVFLFVFSFISNYYFILLLSFLWAIVNEAFRPASLSFISNESTSKQRKTAFALYRLAINLGMSIGPVLGGMLSEISYDLLFYVDAGTCLCAGIFLVAVKWDIRKSETIETETQPELKSTFFSALADKPFLFFLLASLPISIVYMQSMSTLPLFVVENLGFSNSTFGMLIAVNTVLIILIELPLNASMTNWKDENSLYLGALLTGIGFGALAFADSFLLLVTSIVVWTFGEMIFFPGAAAMASEIAPPKRRGEYMGFYQMVFSLSFMLAPYLGTLIYDAFSPRILWIAAFFFSLLSLAFVYFSKVYKQKAIN
jgi:MFS family permease